MDIQWGNKKYQVIDKPTPHIVMNALDLKPKIPGRWGLKTDKVPKACTMDVLHLSAYKGCTVGCEFCSLPAFRGYGLLMYKHGVSVVFEDYDKYVLDKLVSARMVHTFDFGADADAFMEVNDKYHLTEKTMMVLNRFEVPFTVTSKLRYPDGAIDLLAENEANWAQISVVRLDDKSIDLIADNVSRLKKAGVPVTARVQPYIIGYSNPLDELIPALKKLGFDQIVFGFLRAPMGRGKRLLKKYSEGNEYDLEEVYTEKYPGYWQVHQCLQEAFLMNLKSLCQVEGLPLGLCDVYAKDHQGKIISLQPKYGSCKSCECVNGYAYVKKPGEGIFKKVEKCCGNCLLCVSPACGVPEFAESVVADINLYQKMSKRY